MIYHFILPGIPIPLLRPRISRRTAVSKMYNPLKRLKTSAGIYLQSQCSTQHLEEPLTQPVKLIATFFMPIAQFVSNKKRSTMLGTHHYFKPDLSNLLKFLEDAGTGVIYHDDSLISIIEAKKVYDQNPRTEFTIICL